MRTVKQASEQSGIPTTLINAVIRAVGKESLPDVMNHGANTGWAGFTYTADCVAFFKRHKIAILAMVNSMASDMGEVPATMVAGFNCLKIKADDAEGMREVYRALDGRVQGDETVVANALAWFALEEVARAMCDE
jgi:hypothetical protein